MVSRLALIVALASVLLMANEQQPVPDCCQNDSERLSQQQVTALVKKTEPIKAPCCADMLHISGTVILTVSVDTSGSVTCVQMVSGHPLIIGVAIDSVRQWKFRPYTYRGTKKSFCGQIVLRFQATEYVVKYKIL